MTFYVSTQGNDTWSGTRAEPNRRGSEGPFASLARARDAVREARAKGEPAEAQILVRGGKYFVESTLDLEPQDSGLTIQAARGEQVTLFGGRKITGWHQDDEPFWSAPVPAVGKGPWDFRMIAVNGRFCPRARFPENGFLTHLTDFKVAWMSTTGGGWQRKPTEQELTTLKYRPGDFGPGFDIHNAEVTIYHMWDESCVGLAGHDPATQTLKFSVPAGHPPGAFGVKKYVLWNVKEGMNSPGQWYLDRSAGKVVYWPMPGEAMTQAEVIAPAVESIIRLKGTKEAPVRNVALEGLTLSVTNTPLKAGGFGANAFEGALSVSHAQDCLLRGLTLVNVAGQGIKGWGCHRVRVENCETRDTGACGIKVDGTTSTISNCHVHHVGVLYPSAIGVWIGGERMEVSHNEIHHTPYTAVAAGGNGHRIEANLIYEAMEALHDGAGIYITFCKGVTVRGNMIRDINDTGGYGASAYYLDEQAEGCVVEGNLSLRVRRPSHNHMAKKNSIQGNVFLVDGDATLTFPKSSDYMLEKNIVSAAGKIRIEGVAGVTVWSKNLFHSGVGQVEGVTMKDYSAAGTATGVLGDTVVADPLFLDVAKGDYRFHPGSPALKLGIEPIDVSRAGRIMERPMSRRESP